MARRPLGQGGGVAAVREGGVGCPPTHTHHRNSCVDTHKIQAGWGGAQLSPRRTFTATDNFGRTLQCLETNSRGTRSR